MQGGASAVRGIAIVYPDQVEDGEPSAGLGCSPVPVRRARDRPQFLRYSTHRPRAVRGVACMGCGGSLRTRLPQPD